MIDAMAELDFRINRFHGGIPSIEPDEYANLIGEVWHVGAREIERGRVNLGVLDPLTFKQLSTRKSERSENGKRRVESKDKMKLDTPGDSIRLLQFQFVARLPLCVRSCGTLPGTASAVIF